MKNDNNILKFIIQNIKSVASIVVFIALFVPRDFDPIAKLTNYDGSCDALISYVFDASTIVGIIFAIIGLYCLVYFVRTVFINMLGWLSVITGNGVPNGCFYGSNVSLDNIHISENGSENYNGRLTWGEKNRIREALREVDLYQYSNEHRWLKKDKK